MAWLLLENGHLLNTDLVSNVEFREQGEHAGKAVCWGYGVILAAESAVAGQFFRPILEGLLPDRDARLAAHRDEKEAEAARLAPKEAA